MNEHEEKIVSAFIVKEKQERYRFLLGSSGRRRECLDRLNHCRDLNPKYVEWLPRNANIVGLLKQAGCPSQVYLFSSSSRLDGQMLPLAEAITAVAAMPENGWGTIVSCIPGKLAYYYDEEGERHAILRRST